ncbi:hypothetical protein NC661_06520 [Aquibacillus koreensis]|uniref:Uncharacterized protein n=1 Tax=Aquibacillus koreensis TaxID=279446 RepID=A0A9X3WHW0_9BACI|nr:hypothetical protein [Aquibacillus koreensis]MCT2535695.1 hypothetical protein [Aquibacillus koreensis]MDC3420020.1 hypothetical protein [Aquibacillus koreensis]
MKNIDWSKQTLYLEIDKNAQKDDIENFIDMEFSVSVFISDLVVNEDKKNFFGVNLENIKSRLIDEGCISEDINQLIIRVVDVKEVIYMDRYLVS